MGEFTANLRKGPRCLHPVIPTFLNGEEDQPQSSEDENPNWNLDEISVDQYAEDDSRNSKRDP